MRKVIWLIHTSFDGFVATPTGDINWIGFDDELFDDVHKLTGQADTALYGRVTYGMMEAYWPTAAQQPGATQHDIEHGEWAAAAHKFVFSHTLETVSWQNTWILRGEPADEIAKLQTQPGKHLLMLGSPSLAHSFLQHGLIDELYINITPVVLGGGQPLFPALQAPVHLRLQNSKTYANGVIGVHYVKGE